MTSDKPKGKLRPIWLNVIAAGRMADAEIGALHHDLQRVADAHGLGPVVVGNTTGERWERILAAARGHRGDTEAEGQTGRDD